MRKYALPFVKGHMGGNEIILLEGTKIPRDKEIDWCLTVLNSPYIRGHQAGLLYNSWEANHIKAKIVSVSRKDFISSCGGLSQVLGKAILEEHLGEHLGLQISSSNTMLVLETDAGPFQITSEGADDNMKNITTNMAPFVGECYRLGVRVIEIAGVRATQVGKVLVVAAEEVRRRFADVNLEHMDESTLEVLWQLHREFLCTVFPDSRGGDFAIYDLLPSRDEAVGRVIFPHYIPEGHIEPACGTGAVAIGIAIAEQGNVLPSNGTAELSFESGGSSLEIGGPDLTKLRLTMKDGKVIDACFSHSLVEILAVGQVWL